MRVVGRVADAGSGGFQGWAAACWLGEQVAVDSFDVLGDAVPVVLAFN